MRQDRLPEGFPHRVGGLSAHAGQHVGVGVEGDHDGGVSQKLLHELQMGVLLEQQRRAGVAQAVEGDLRQTRSFEGRHERPLTEV
jgi:hypothetical protein